MLIKLELVYGHAYALKVCVCVYIYKVIRVVCSQHFRILKEV